MPTDLQPDSTRSAGGLLAWLHACSRKGWLRLRAYLIGARSGRLRARPAPHGTVLDEPAGSLVHELVQPLTAIATNAEAARRSLQQQDADLRALREIVDDINIQTRRALDIADWIRGELRGDTPPAQLVDLAEAARDVVGMLGNAALCHDTRVRARLPARPLYVRGSRVQIQQVLINLLLNALQATTSMPHGRRHVRLVAWQHGSTVRTTVRDSGPGTAEHELERIFQPFFTARPGGLGLGLAISRSIARRHGGDLTARNNAGPGMTFCLQLPAAAHP